MNTKLRKNYIGGSDIPAILGLSPWQSREDLLREKITGESERYYSQAMAFGHQYESVIINGDALMNDYEILPVPDGKDQHEVIGEIDGFETRCHLDGIGEKNGVKFLIECKTGATPFGGVLPEHYQSQVQFYMHRTNLDTCIIAFGQRMVDGTLGSQESFVVEKQLDWWDKYLPEIQSFIADIRKGEVPPKYLPAPMERWEIAEYINICQIYEQAESFITKFREILAEKMSNAGIKKCYLGGFCASLTEESETKTFDSTKFKKENPELVSKYEKVLTRKGGLRITKSKQRSEINLI